MISNYFLVYSCFVLVLMPYNLACSAYSQSSFYIHEILVSVKELKERHIIIGYIIHIEFDLSLFSILFILSFAQ